MKNLKFYKIIIPAFIAVVLLLFLTVFTDVLSDMFGRLGAQLVQMSFVIHPAPSITTEEETFSPSQTESHSFAALSEDFFTFTNPDESFIKMLFSPDTTSVSIDFFIHSYDENFVIFDRPLPSGLDVIGDMFYDFVAFEGSTEKKTFDANFTLEFHYTDDQIAAFEEGTLKVYFWDESQSIWVQLSNFTLDQTNNTIFVFADHLTLFAIFGEPAPASEPSPAPSGGGGGSGIVVPPAPPIYYVGVNGATVVSPDKGGFVVLLNADGSSFTLDIPKAFWTLPVTFTFTTISKKTAISVAVVPQAFFIVGGQVYSVLAKDAQGTLVTRFLKPITIIFDYTNAQAAGFDEKTLKMYSLNQVLKVWEIIPNSTIDISRNIVSGSIDHLTLFTIMGQIAKPINRVADFNQDGRVDAIDFSILLYNWGILKNSVTDINQDGKVDTVDFSIFLYWWTG